MANELNLNANLSYEDAEGTSDVLDVVNLLKSVTNKRIIHQKVSVPTGTSAAGIDVSAVPAVGYVMFLNLDPTNYIDLYSDNGDRSQRLDPVNGFALFKAGPDFQSPKALANTAACQMEYLLIST